ncbi:MAG: UDP-N-acetylmuramate dehydrogenase, partial [Planctomycetes bacterium]|nr:UDP-N-acetylmuramate dehydrogenase [Planctomycetota bacterium]
FACFNKLDERRVVVGAAMPLQAFLRKCADAGLAGLEDMAGIPGTVGGAIRMNAGSPVHGIGIFVEQIRGYDLSGREILMKDDQLRFSYRWSNLGDIIITEAVLSLNLGEPEEILDNMQSFRKAKQESQPVDQRTAGCVFKNTAQYPAGMLVDKCGLKGRCYGGATVSDVHANFIVNRDNATCDDVRSLISEIREEVKNKYGIDLHLEIELWL